MSSAENAEATIRLTRLATTASLATAVLLTCLKLMAALVTGSVALLSLLIDSVADIGASAVTFLAVRVAQTPPDAGHRYGHGKAEAISALAQAAVVTGSALFVLVEAAQRLLVPEQVTADRIGIAVTTVSILLTGALVLFQRDVVRRTGSTAVAADRLHYTSDMAAGVAVLASLVLGPRLGHLWLDPAVGGAIAALMLRGAAGIASTALAQLMDRELPDRDRTRIEAIVLAHPNVDGMHDLRSRQAAGTCFIEFHIEIDGGMSVRAAHQVTDTLEQALEAAFPGAEILIHQEPAGVEDARLDARIAGER